MIFPRFGHLYTNASNYERMRELRELSTRFALSQGRAFVVMPDYPLVHFLSDTRNPLSIDWFEPWEYLGNEDRLLREVATRQPVVLVEREPSLIVGASAEPLAPCDRPTAADTAIVSAVVSHWSLMAEGRHFCVYRAPS